MLFELKMSPKNLDLKFKSLLADDEHYDHHVCGNSSHCSSHDVIISTDFPIFPGLKRKKKQRFCNGCQNSVRGVNRKKAFYKFKGEEYIYCEECREDGMVDVKNKTCEKCDKRPVFNMPGETKARFCAAHKEDGMVDVKSKTCEKCNKRPVFNTPGETKARFCVAHKEDGMVDVKNKPCPNCIDWIDSRCGSIKYDNYCATCFKRLFPDDPRSTIIYIHEKEIHVRNAITEKGELDEDFKGFVHDKPLYTNGCNCIHRRRVDHRKLFGNTLLAIETDEFSHRKYDKSDEEIRYDDLYMIYSGKWIYIRFNPDETRNDKTDIEDRITVLLDTMAEQVERIRREENEDLVEIIKLFY